MRTAGLVCSVRGGVAAAIYRLAAVATQHARSQRWPGLGLDKTLFCVWAFVHESIDAILCVRTLCLGIPPHPIIAHTIAQSNGSLRPPGIAIYIPQYWQLQYYIVQRPSDGMQV